MKTTRSRTVPPAPQRPDASALERFASVLAAALLAGCASRMAPSQNAYVYIAENTAITFDGETFMQVEELPRRLTKAGATPENTIVLIPQGEVPPVYLRSLVNACGRGGLPNVVIREQVAPTSEAQRLGAGLPRQSGATPPRFIAPGAKGKPMTDARNKKKK